MRAVVVFRCCLVRASLLYVAAVVADKVHLRFSF